MSEQKFCKDCKHVKPIWMEVLCNSPHIPLDMVTGLKEYTPCSVERIYGCGPDAEHFEQNPSPPPQPPAPKGRIILESCGVFCPECGSSMPRQWVIFGKRRCLGGCH